MDYGWPASRSYVVSSVAAWALFLAGIVLLSWGAGENRLPQPVLWLIALGLAASVALQFAAAYRLIARQDEFVRALTAKRMIAAAGLTITLGVLWGIAEQFLGAPDGPLWLIYPFYRGAFGMVSPLIKGSTL